MIDAGATHPDRILSFAAQRGQEANAMLVAAKALLLTDACRQFAHGHWRDRVSIPEDARTAADQLLDAAKQAISEVMAATDLYAEGLQKFSTKESVDAVLGTQLHPVCAGVATAARSMQESLRQLTHLTQALDKHESAIVDHSAEILDELLTRIQSGTR